MGDDDKEAILARRRQFIALALAGGATVGAAAIGAGAYATMAPCLSPPVTEQPDAGLDGGSDAPIPIDAGSPTAEVTPPSAELVPPSVPAEPPAAAPEPEVRARPRGAEGLPRACLSRITHPSDSLETPPGRLPRVTE